MAKKNLFYGLCLLTIVYSCANNTKKTWDGLAALQGKWNAVLPEGLFVETWTKKENAYVGVGYLLNGTDTVFKENLALTQNKSDIYYEVIVGNEKVAFKCTSFSENTWVFENEKNPFPAKITYTQLDKTHWHVNLNGIENGKPRHEKFEFVKQEIK